MTQTTQNTARTAFPWHSIRYVNGAVRDRYEVYRTDTGQMTDDFPFNSELERGKAYADAQSVMVELKSALKAGRISAARAAIARGK